MTTERLAQLRQDIDQHFNDEDLRTLCFDLGVDYDNLPGRAKAGKVIELLAYLDRAGRIADLVAKCARLRSNVDWQAIVESAEAEPPYTKRTLKCPL